LKMNADGQQNVADDDSLASRRAFLQSSCAIGVTSMLFAPQRAFAAASTLSLDTLVPQIEQAKEQMKSIPNLIQKEEWDAVRAILIKPPLSDLWTKSSRKMPFLMEYAEAVGSTPNGDELAVLEAKEDVEGHLRFLDMAVYNNVFNPIKSMGVTGATKELIRSYYEDPINEYKATVAALEELIQLGKAAK
jgi:hypothetical protein